MTYSELKKLSDYIMQNGPTRVVINEHGEATAPNRAPVPPEVIFIRRDGWSLGAPTDLVSVAEQMWADEWVGVLTKEEAGPIFYQNWRQARRL